MPPHGPPRLPATLCETCCKEGPSGDRGSVAGRPTSPAPGSLVPEPTVTLNMATSAFGARRTLAFPQHSPQRCTKGPLDEPTLGTKAADAWTSQKAPTKRSRGQQPSACLGQRRGTDHPRCSHTDQGPRGDRTVSSPGRVHGPPSPTARRQLSAAPWALLPQYPRSPSH